MKKIVVLLSLAISFFAQAQLPQPILRMLLDGTSSSNNVITSSGVSDGIEIGAGSGSVNSNGRCTSPSSESYDFFANNDKNIYVNDASLNIANPFSISFWNYSYPYGDYCYVSKNPFYLFITAERTLRVSVTGVGMIISNVTITDANWDHITLTKDASNNFTFYKNGIAAGTGNLTLTSSGTNLFINGYSTNGTSYISGRINGQMSDFRYYNVALSDGQVKTAYTSSDIVNPPNVGVCSFGGNSFQMPLFPENGSSYIYTWWKDGVSISGSNYSTLTVTSADIGAVFSVSGSSTCGSFASDIAVVQAGTFPSPTITGITGSGNSRCLNSSTTVTCSALGASLTYQWLKNGLPITVGTDGGVYKNFATANLSITGFPSSLVGAAIDFTCSVTGICDGVLSSIFTITVLGAPTFAGLSLGASACAGTSYTLSGTGINSTSFQWRRGFNLNAGSDGGIYSNFTTQVLSISGLPGNATSTVLGYTLRAFGACGTTTSSVINITVNGITSVSGLIANTNYCIGNTRILAITTNSGVGFNYQWGKWNNTFTTLTTLSNGVFYSGFGTVSGANTQNLSISGMQSNISEFVIATVTGLCGSFQSSVAGFSQLAATGATITGPNLVVCNGDPINFYSTVVGVSAYLWRVSTNGGSTYSNAAGGSAGANTYTNANAGDNGKYYALSVSGVCGVFTTSGTLLSVQNNTSITTVISPLVCQGSSGVVATVTAISVNPVYSWYKNNVAITTSTDGGIFGTSFTTSGLSITNAPRSLSGANVFVTENGDCGVIQTSSGIALNIGTIAGVSVNPPSVFTTCLGSSVAISALGTGTGVNYQWQYFLGSWQNVTNTGGLFSGATTSQLTVSNLPSVLDNVSFRLSVTGTCGIGNASQVSTLQVNFGPNVSVFGLQSKYCINNSNDILEAFTDLNLPQSAVAGTFSALSGGAGLSTAGVGFNKAVFRPSAYNNTTAVAIRYQSAPDAVGCRNNTTLTSTVYTVSGFGLQLTALANTSYPNSQTKPVNLILTATGGAFTGTNSFYAAFGGMTNSGVVGSLFYPSNVAPAPTAFALTKDVYIIGQFTEQVSGCSDTITAKVNVFFPQTNYTFTPLTTLDGYVNLPNKSTFCSTDYAMRLISFTGFQTPEQNLIGLTSYCVKNYSIGVAGTSSSVMGNNTYFEPSLGPSGMTRNEMNSFKFTPGYLNSGNHSMIYNYDFATPQSGCTTPTRSTPFEFSQSRQQITVYAKPSPPAVSNHAVCEDLINLNHALTLIANNQNVEWYTTTSTSSIIISLSGFNNVTLQQFGFSTATGVGMYTFYVRQFVNGCPSDPRAVTIQIKQKPALPTITTSFPSIGTCASTNYNYFSAVMNSTTTGIDSYTWNTSNNGILYFNNFSATNDSSTYDYILTSLPQTLTISGRVIKNNCSSNLNYKLIDINPLPPVPTIIGFNDGCLDYNSTFQFPSISFEANYNLPLTFESSFYTPNPYNYFSLSFSNTTFNGTSSKSFNTTQPLITTTGQVYLHGYSSVNTITGCRSNPLYPFKNIYITPQPPISTQTDIYCNGSLYGIISASGLNLKWYSDFAATSSMLASGNIFNVASAMPINRYLKDAHVDSTFYATQSQNGCESSTTGVRFRMYEPFKNIPVSSVSLPGTYFSLANGLEICNSTIAGIASAVNYGSTSHSLGGTRNLYFTNNIAGTGIAGVFALPSSINHSMGSFTAGQNPKFDVQEKFITPVNKVCSSIPTLSGWQLTIKPNPSAPVLRDTAYCMPVVVGNVLATSTVSGGLLPTFRWHEAYNSGGYISTFLNATTTGSSVTGIYESIFNTAITGTIANSVLDSTGNKYYVTQIVNGCESATSRIGKLKLFPTPFIPSVTSKEEFCIGDILNPLSVASNSTSAQIDWFLTTAVGSMVATSVTSYMPSINSVLGWTTTATSFVDYVGFTAALNYKQRYAQLDFAGCRSGFASDTIRIKAIPPIPLTAASVTYCVEKTALANDLTASGIGGLNADFTWRNNLAPTDNIAPPYKPGVNLSSPSISTFSVFQTYDGCESPINVVTITVYALPIVTFTGLNNSYCDKALPTTLVGSNTALISKQFSVFDITSTITGSAYLITFAGNGQVAVFDVRNPAATIDKKFSVTYAVVDINGCSSSHTENTTAYARQDVTFFANGIGNLDSVFCSNNPPVELISNPFSGIFSTTIPGAINGNIFIPSASGVITNAPSLDVVKIRFDFLDDNACSNFSERLFTIKPTPAVKFKMSSHCVGNVSLTGLSTIVGKSGDALQQFAWFINNDSISNQKDAMQNFFASGLYNIFYRLRSDLGCESSFDADSTIDAYPIVNFDWKNICTGDVTEFTNKSIIPIGGGLLKNVVWTFANTAPQTMNSLTINPTFSFPNADPYSVSLSVSTQENCVSSITSTVHILPFVTIIGFDSYTENFDNNAGKWFTNGTNSSWIWNSITGINSSPHWETTLNNGNHFPDERSYLYGPCLDIRGLNRPMIRLDLKYKTTNANNDGLVLQFAANGDTVWQPVGNQGTGVNWYKTRNIINNPGEQVQYLTNILNNPKTASTTGTYFRQLGWNGNSQNWITARNTLDEAKAQSNSINGKIRLRLAFATSGNTVSEGFEVDNVVINSRSKKTLIENFANANSAASNAVQAQTLDNFIIKNKEDVVGLNYHTSFPSPDIFNTFNPSDPSTRVLFYGVETIPRAAVNGEMVLGNSSNIGLNFLLDQTLLDPEFEIRAAFTNQNNLFAVTAQFVANKQLATSNNSLKEYIAQVAIVEKTVSSIPNQTLVKTYKNVLKRMMPNPAGTSLIDTWNLGSSKTISQSWAYANGDIYNKDSLAAIIFIQDKETKKVLQAQLVGIGASQTAVPTSIAENKTLENGLFMVYPNPSKDVFYINYTLSDAKKWELYDITGRLILEGSLENGSKAEIDAQNLASGVYHLKIGNAIKKLMVD